MLLYCTKIAENSIYSNLQYSKIPFNSNRVTEDYWNQLIKKQEYFDQIINNTIGKQKTEINPDVCDTVAWWNVIIGKLFNVYQLTLQQSSTLL